AIFIFVTEDGTISGWNPDVDPNHAVLKVNLPGSIFKGAAIAQCRDKTLLYAADFHHGRILAFDTNFQMLRPGNRFQDDQLPQGFAPFNVANIGGNLYVTFAKQDEDKEDDVAGAGLGFVDVFTPCGEPIQRLQHGPWLNAPWGVTLAPSDFGV